jgi:hypothetical protein
MNELNINKKKRKKIFIYLSTLNKKSNKDTTRCTSPNVSEKSINQTLELSLVSHHKNLPSLAATYQLSSTYSKRAFFPYTPQITLSLGFPIPNQKHQPHQNMF